MPAPKKSNLSTESGVRGDEAWIRAPDADVSIRIRSLTYYLNKGGAIVHARLHQSKNGAWSLWLRLADRAGEFRLNQFHEDVPKTWLDVSLAIANLQDEYRYFGGVALTTDRRPQVRRRRVQLRLRAFI